MAIAHWKVGEPMNSHLSAARLRRYGIGALLVLPCTAILIVMMVNPSVQTLVFSFSRVTLPKFDTVFIGFDNFWRVFSKPEIGMVLFNTLVWMLGTVVLRFVLGFWAALTMNAGFRGAGIFRILILLPWTVPSIVAANTWRWILQSDYGLLNGVLRSWGLGQLAHSWLGDPATALASVMLAYCWAGYPFVMMMLLAGMQGIPKELYDAGKVDGANAWQIFRYITIPSLRSVLIIVLLLEVISSLNSFDVLFALTGGGPGGATEILGLFIYRLGFTNFDFAGASAVSVVLIGLALGCFIVYGSLSLKKKRGAAHHG
jgi:multiple sugar transport system permease protein